MHFWPTFEVPIKMTLETTATTTIKMLIGQSFFLHFISSHIFYFIKCHNRIIQTFIILNCHPFKTLYHNSQLISILSETFMKKFKAFLKQEIQVNITIHLSDGHRMQRLHIISFRIKKRKWKQKTITQISISFDKCEIHCFMFHICFVYECTSYALPSWSSNFCLRVNVIVRMQQQIQF